MNRATATFLLLASPLCTLAQTGLNAGDFDYYALALSWSNQYCDGKCNGQTPWDTCHYSDADHYSASAFTLHGLWPNHKDRSSGWPQYCVHPTLGDYSVCAQSYNPSQCEVDPAIINAYAVEGKFDTYAPGFSPPGTLARHEWVKHGTCIHRDVDEAKYFDVSLDMTEDFNKGDGARMVVANMGNNITYSALSSAFEFKVAFVCKSCRLEEIRPCFKRMGNSGQNLPGAQEDCWEGQSDSCQNCNRVAILPHQGC